MSRLAILLGGSDRPHNVLHLIDAPDFGELVFT